MVSTFFINNLHSLFTQDLYHFQDGTSMKTNILVHKLSKKLNIIIYCLMPFIAVNVKELALRQILIMMCLCCGLFTVNNMIIVVAQGYKFTYYAEQIPFLIIVLFVVFSFLRLYRKKV